MKGNLEIRCLEPEWIASGSKWEPCHISLEYEEGTKMFILKDETVGFLIRSTETLRLLINIIKVYGNS